jgi:hypothetical protein
LQRTLKSALHSSVFARLASGTFYEIIMIEENKKAAEKAAFFAGAEGGTRTRMSIARHPLKMVCLPNSTTSATNSPQRTRSAQRRKKI